MTLCGGVGGYDQLCCPASPKLMLGLDLGLGRDNKKWRNVTDTNIWLSKVQGIWS